MKTLRLQPLAIAQILFNELLIGGVNLVYLGAVTWQRVVVLKWDYALTTCMAAFIYAVVQY